MAHHVYYHGAPSLPLHLINPATSLILLAAILALVATVLTFRRVHG